MKKMILAFLGLFLVLNPMQQSYAALTTEQKTDRLGYFFDHETKFLKYTRDTESTHFLLTGATSTLAGVIMFSREPTDPYLSSSSKSFYPTFLVAFGGAMLVVGGLFKLLELPNESDWSVETGVARDAPLEKRLEALEGLLRKRAEKERQDRINGAFLGFGLGVLGTGAYFLSERTYSNQFWLFFGALFTANGINALLHEGLHEQELRRYEAEAKGDKAEKTENLSKSLNLGLVTTPSGGLGAGMALSF